MRRGYIKGIFIVGILSIILTFNNTVSVSCHENLVNSNQQNTNKSKQELEPVLSEQSQALSREQMFQDYDNMWKIILENYPYIGVAERVTKLNFNDIRSKYRNKIELVANDKEFFDLIKECLVQFGGCGHMLVLNRDAYISHMEVSYKYRINPTHKYLYNIMNNKISKHFYQYNPKNTNSDNQLMNAAVDNNIITNVIYKQYPKDKTAYIKINSFANLENEKNNIKKFIHNNKSFDNLIIDIRGNTGGNAEYWWKYLVLPNLKKNLSYNETMLVRGSLSKKFVSCVSDLKPILKLNKTNYTKININDLGLMDNYIVNRHELEKAKKPEFTGKIYLLVDNKVYSAAEGLAYFCKSTGWATIIGENTGGDGMLMNPMVCVLRNSGICFQFTAQLGLNSDGSSNEEAGTSPDITCKSKDAMKICLQIIRKKAK